MKVHICSASSWAFGDNVIIEVNSIDEAIKRVQKDKTLVEKVINKNVTDLFNTKTGEYDIPTTFIVNTEKEDNYDIELEIYDSYRE